MLIEPLCNLTLVHPFSLLLAKYSPPCLERIPKEDCIAWKMLLQEFHWEHSVKPAVTEGRKRNSVSRIMKRSLKWNTWNYAEAGYSILQEMLWCQQCRPRQTMIHITGQAGTMHYFTEVRFESFQFDLVEISGDKPCSAKNTCRGSSRRNLFNPSVPCAKHNTANFLWSIPSEEHSLGQVIVPYLCLHLQQNQNSNS